MKIHFYFLGLLFRDSIIILPVPNNNCNNYNQRQIRFFLALKFNLDLDLMDF